MQPFYTSEKVYSQVESMILLRSHNLRIFWWHSSHDLSFGPGLSPIFWGRNVFHSLPEELMFPFSALGEHRAQPVGGVFPTPNGTRYYNWAGMTAWLSKVWPFKSCSILINSGKTLNVHVLDKNQVCQKYDGKSPKAKRCWVLPKHPSTVDNGGYFGILFINISLIKFQKKRWNSFFFGNPQT